MTYRNGSRTNWKFSLADVHEELAPLHAGL